MNKGDQVWIILFVFLIGVIAIGVIGSVFGQTALAPPAGTTTSQQVQQVAQEVQQNNAQIDTTTTLAGGTAAGVVANFLTQWFQGKKLRKEDKGTDKDVGTSLLIRYRLIQAMEVYVPGMKEALDQPFNTDTMQKDVTIRKKIAEDSQGWAEYMMTALQAFPPSMTPSASVSLAAMNNPTAGPAQANTANTQGTTGAANNNAANTAKPGA